MKNPMRSNLPAKLAQGRKCFEKWRHTHKPYTRLPEHLWALAAELAREYGLNKTARTLRLDYNGLKKRIEFPVSGDASQAIPTPQFLELLPSGTNSSVECRIEWADGGGSTVRMHIQGANVAELTSLASVLWGGRA